MEALGRLAGGIAHDFNNVLQAVEGSASLALRSMDTDPDTARRFLRLAADACTRGAAVTERLLAFGRRSPLRATALDTAASLLDGLADMLRPTLGRAHRGAGGLRARPAAAAGRPQPARGGAGQPRQQRARRDAAWRPPAAGGRSRAVSGGRPRGGPGWRGPGWGGPGWGGPGWGGPGWGGPGWGGIRARVAIHGEAGRDRRGRGHVARDPAARVRALLHHQADGTRHRAGPGDGARLHRAVRRHVQRSTARAGRRHHGHDRAPAGAGWRHRRPRDAPGRGHRHGRGAGHVAGGVPIGGTGHAPGSGAPGLGAGGVGRGGVGADRSRSCWWRTAPTSAPSWRSSSPRTGYSITAVEDASAALALLDGGYQPEAIVADLALPGRQDGLDLLSEARVRLPQLPAVILTGHMTCGRRGTAGPQRARRTRS